MLAVSWGRMWEGAHGGQGACAQGSLSLGREPGRPGVTRQLAAGFFWKHLRSHVWRSSLMADEHSHGRLGQSAGTWLLPVARASTELGGLSLPARPLRSAKLSVSENLVVAARPLMTRVGRCMASFLPSHESTHMPGRKCRHPQLSIGRVSRRFFCGHFLKT